MLTSLFVAVACGGGHSGGGLNSTTSWDSLPLGVGPAIQPLASQPAISGDIIKITSINGTAGPVHATDVYIHAGDVVSFSADLFKTSRGLAPSNAPVEDFIWSASLKDNDVCNVSLNVNCLQNSSFQVNDFGVSFYSPYLMPATVQIFVRSIDPSEVDGNHHPIYDSVLIHNMDATVSGAIAAPALIADPANYPGASLNENVALVGMGRWLSIGDVRYFAPYSYVTAGETEWAPYQHGYWAWEPTAGWTWISYDPWGWMTDHYGVWRHHASYGWLWVPFEDRHYEPHCATWMDDGNTIGWYPYHEGFSAAYAHGENEGFDDGYWLGFRVGAGFGEPAYRFHPGFSAVNRADVTSINLSLVLLNRSSNPAFPMMIRNSVAHNRVFSIPGGNRNLERAFVENGASRPAAVTVNEMITSHGGAKFMIARSSYPVPDENQRVLSNLKSGKSILPIGSVVQVSRDSSRILLPAPNGRGLIAAPRTRDANGNPIGIMTAHTLHPTQFDPATAQAIGRRPGPEPRTLPVAQMPHYNPHEKAPPSVLPKSLPVPARPDTPKTAPLTPPVTIRPQTKPAEQVKPEPVKPLRIAPTQPAKPKAPKSQPVTPETTTRPPAAPQPKAPKTSTVNPPPVAGHPRNKAHRGDVPSTQPPLTAGPPTPTTQNPQDGSTRKPRPEASSSTTRNSDDQNQGRPPGQKQKRKNET